MLLVAVWRRNGHMLPSQIVGYSERMSIVAHTLRIVCVVHSVSSQFAVSHFLWVGLGLGLGNVKRRSGPSWFTDNGFAPSHVNKTLIAGTARLSRLGDHGHPPWCLPLISASTIPT